MTTAKFREECRNYARNSRCHGWHEGQVLGWSRMATLVGCQVRSPSRASTPTYSYRQECSCRMDRCSLRSGRFLGIGTNGPSAHHRLGHGTWACLGRVETRTTKQWRPRSRDNVSDSLPLLSPRVGLNLDAVKVKLKLIESALRSGSEMGDRQRHRPRRSATWLLRRAYPLPCSTQTYAYSLFFSLHVGNELGPFNLHHQYADELDPAGAETFDDSVKPKL